MFFTRFFTIPFDHITLVYRYAPHQRISDIIARTIYYVPVCWYNCRTRKLQPVTVTLTVRKTKCRNRRKTTKSKDC